MFTWKEELSILKSNDANQILDYIQGKKKVRKKVLSKLEDTIIKTGNAKSIYEFLICVIESKIEGANIPKLEEALIATRNAEYIFKLAIFSVESKMEGFNISKLEDALIATGNAEYIFKLVIFSVKSKVEGANILKLEDALIATRNAEYIYKLAIFSVESKVEGFNISKYEDALIATRNAEYIYELAIFRIESKMEGFNISKYEDAIIATGNAEYIYKFTIFVMKSKIEGANISKLVKATIKAGDAQYAYDFVKNPDGVNIEGLKESQRQELENSTSIPEKISNPIIELKDYKLLLDSREKMATEAVDNMEDDMNKMTKFSYYLIDSDLNSLLSEEEFEWLINLSLTKQNVFLSTVASIANDKEKRDLYLELLKKLDLVKYYLYRDAFLGKKSFQVADGYYKDYLAKQKTR